MKSLLKQVKVNNGYINLYKNIIDNDTVEYSLFFNEKHLFKNPTVIQFYNGYSKIVSYDKYIYLTKDEIEKFFIESLKYFEDNNNAFDEIILFESNQYLVRKFFNPLNRLKYSLKKLFKYD